MGLSKIQVGIWDVIGAALGMQGTHWYVDPKNGADGNSGSKDNPFATLYKAHAAANSGTNDVVHLVSDGTTASTARLSLALAQSVTPTATAGTLTWSKNALHLVGESAPSANSRARIAPPTGVYTLATFASGNFVNVTGAGCMFKNFSVFGGFSTGGASEIAWTDAGRNYYEDVELFGAVDAYSATHTDSRTLVLTGNIGESVFRRCTIGDDTVARTVANATVEFKGGTPRNRFVDCVFPFYATNAGVLGFITSAAAAMDREQLFVRCDFLNGVGSAGTTMTALATLAAGSGGILAFRDSFIVGASGYGTDATSRGQIYIVGAQGTANATLSMSGLANTPNA